MKKLHIEFEVVCSDDLDGLTYARNAIEVLEIELARKIDFTTARITPDYNGQEEVSEIKLTTTGQ